MPLHYRSNGTPTGTSRLLMYILVVYVFYIVQYHANLSLKDMSVSGSICMKENRVRWSDVGRYCTSSNEHSSAAVIREARSRYMYEIFGWYGHRTAMHSGRIHDGHISRHEQQPNQENQVGDTCTHSYVT